MIDKYTLKLRQSMPLQDKIRFTERRITEWVEHFGVNGCYISFSGGKDSTVLMHFEKLEDAYTSMKWFKERLLQAQLECEVNE